MTRRSLLHAAIWLALAAATGLMGQAGAAAARSGVERRVAALPAIPFLEAMALGYREVVADVAWLQAVQYYGEHRQGGNDLSQFEHYVRAVNVLDPRFEHAYVFGATVLATDGRDPRAGLEVLRRGARANPSSSTFPFEMGFLSYIAAGDTPSALRYFACAARYPEERDRALRFEAYLNRRLGRRETALLLWEDIYRTSADPGLRLVAADNMRHIQSDLERKP